MSIKKRDIKKERGEMREEKSHNSFYSPLNTKASNP